MSKIEREIYVQVRENFRESQGMFWQIFGWEPCENNFNTAQIHEKNQHPISYRPKYAQFQLFYIENSHCNEINEFNTNKNLNTHFPV